MYIECIQTLLCKPVTKAFWITETDPGVGGEKFKTLYSLLQHPALKPIIIMESMSKFSVLRP